MTGTVPMDDLERSVCARWWSSSVGPRSRWRTRTAYYQAVGDLLAAGHHELSWRTVVDAVSPRGNRSTFFTIAGPGAKNTLLAALVHDGSLQALALALCYQRGSATDQLVDETKMWSYWPHRLRWLSHLRHCGTVTGETATRSLEAAVERWARIRPRLAAALDTAPPVGAVEDLALLSGLPAVRARRVLSQVMSFACAST